VHAALAGGGGRGRVQTIVAGWHFEGRRTVVVHGLVRVALHGLVTGLRFCFGVARSVRRCWVRLAGVHGCFVRVVLVQWSDDAV
jgi:hypothetical protein